MHPQAEYDRDLRKRLAQDFNTLEPADTHDPAHPKADQILLSVAEILAQRGAQRDTPQGERSMTTAVSMFRLATGIELSVAQGWHFMVILKLARMRGNRGPVNPDDFLDAIGYLALELETILE
jgi:hypothetical protein